MDTQLKGKTALVTGASAGIGFAVPVDTVNRIVPQLINNGDLQRPWLGTNIASDRVAAQANVRVSIDDPAAVLAILCQPLHQRFLGWTRNRESLAAGLTTAVVLASMLGPLITGTVAAARHIDRVTRSRMDDRSWRAIFENAKHSETVKSLVTRYGQLTGDPVQFDEIEKRQRYVAVLEFESVSFHSNPHSLSCLSTAALAIVTSPLCRPRDGIFCSLRSFPTSKRKSSSFFSSAPLASA